MLDTIPPGRLTSRCALIVSNETSSANYQYGAVGGFGAFGQAVLLAHALDSYPFRILNSPPGHFYVTIGWSLVFTGAAFVVTLALLVSIYLAPVRDRYPGGGMSAFLMGDFQACVFSEWLSLM